VGAFWFGPLVHPGESEPGAKVALAPESRRLLQESRRLVAVRGELIRSACWFVRPEVLVRADRFIEQGMAGMIVIWINC
jgi:hypothetical protein